MPGPASRRSKPQSGTAAGPGPRRIGAIETLEHPRRILLTHTGTLVGDLDHRIVALGPNPKDDVGAVGVCCSALATQIAQHLAQPGLVADHFGGARAVEDFHA